MSCICGTVDIPPNTTIEEIGFRLEKSRKTQTEIDEMSATIKKSLEKPGFPPVIGKDLPRLISKFQTVSEKNVTISSPIVQLIFDLSLLVLPQEKIVNPRDLQDSYDLEVKSTDYETLNAYLLKWLGEESFVIQILKSTTQATLARPIILLKQLFQEQNLEFKDEEWKIDVIKSDGYIQVVHRRSERVEVQPDTPEFEVFFRFSWKLILSYDEKSFKFCKMSIVFGDYQYNEKVRRGTNKNGPTEVQVKELLDQVFGFVKDEIVFQ